MFCHVVCLWCIWCYTSMFKPSVFCKVFKILAVEWRSIVSTQFVEDAEVSHDLVHCWMMAEADVDVIILTAGKWENRHCTTSTYSVLWNNSKSLAWRCSCGPFGSSFILNGSCCLGLITAWQGRPSSTAMVSFLSMPGNQMCSLAYCFIFTNHWCLSSASWTAFD